MKLSSILVTAIAAGVTGSCVAQAASFKSLYSFAGGADGANPEAGLTNVGGTLYGTTYNGGVAGSPGAGPSSR